MVLLRIETEERESEGVLDEVEEEREMESMFYRVVVLGQIGRLTMIALVVEGQIFELFKNYRPNVSLNLLYI